MTKDVKTERIPNLTERSLVGHNVALIKVFDRKDRFVTDIVADCERISKFEIARILRDMSNRLFEEYFDECLDKLVDNI